jgi:hypothetical protein
MNTDAGDSFVSEVASQIGSMSPDEQAAVYGAGYAYATGTDQALPPDSPGWVATVLRDFRVAPCPFCHHRLLEHTLSLSEAGPSVVCDADGTSRFAWDWHPGPRPKPAWLVLLAVALWVGLPLLSVGLASWLMPLVSAFMYKRRAWAMAAAGWGALTVLLVVLIENEVLATIMGFLALVLWFGSAVYGGFQVKPWLSRAADRNR